ncbi:hypothetical protein BHE74_00027201, partial [Ensete ventricosum]
LWDGTMVLELRKDRWLQWPHLTVTHSVAVGATHVTQVLRGRDRIHHHREKKKKKKKKKKKRRRRRRRQGQRKEKRGREAVATCPVLTGIGMHHGLGFLFWQ